MQFTLFTESYVTIGVSTPFRFINNSIQLGNGTNPFNHVVPSSTIDCTQNYNLNFSSFNVSERSISGSIEFKGYCTQGFTLDSGEITFKVSVDLSTGFTNGVPTITLNTITISSPTLVGLKISKGLNQLGTISASDIVATHQVVAKTTTVTGNTALIDGANVEHNVTGFAMDISPTNLKINAGHFKTGNIDANITTTADIIVNDVDPFPTAGVAVIKSTDGSQATLTADTSGNITITVQDAAGITVGQTLTVPWLEL